MDLAVLFVCTGNICRSPTAERMLRSRVDGLPISVASAGTAGLTGRAMDEAAALAARELGVDTEGHVARRLEVALTEPTDLVLTADTVQRAAVVQAQPLLFRQVFTMREFARLGADLPPLTAENGAPDNRSDRDGVTGDVLRARVREVAGRRGHLPPAAPGADDIADPFGAGLQVARASAVEIAQTVDGVLRALGLS